MNSVASDLINPWNSSKVRKLARAPAVISACCAARRGSQEFFDHIVAAFDKARKEQSKSNLPVIQVIPGGGIGMEQMLGNDENARAREFGRLLRKSGLEAASWWNTPKVLAFLVVGFAYYYSESVKAEAFSNLKFLLMAVGGGFGWFVGSLLEGMFGKNGGAGSIQNPSRLQARLREDGGKRQALHGLMAGKMHESAFVMVIRDFHSLDDASKNFIETYFSTYSTHSHTWLDERVEVWFFCDSRHPGQLRTIFSRAGQDCFVPDYIKQQVEASDQPEQAKLETRTPPVRLLNDLSKASHMEAGMLAALSFYGDNTLAMNAFHAVMAVDDFNENWAVRLIGPGYRKLDFKKLQKVAARLANSEDPSLMAQVLKPAGGAQIWFGSCPGPLIQKQLPWAGGGGVEKTAAFLILRLTHLSGTEGLSDTWILIQHLLHHLLDECTEWVAAQSLDKELWRCAHELLGNHVLNLRHDEAGAVRAWIQDRCPYEDVFAAQLALYEHARILVPDPDTWPQPSADSAGGLVIDWLGGEFERTMRALETEDGALMDQPPSLPAFLLTPGADSTPSGMDGALNGLALSCWLLLAASDLRIALAEPEKLAAALRVVSDWEGKHARHSMHAVEELAFQALAAAAAAVNDTAERAGVTALKTGKTGRTRLEGDLPVIFSDLFVSLAQIEGSAMQILMARSAAVFLTSRYLILADCTEELARNDAFIELLTEEAYGSLMRTDSPMSAAGFVFLALDSLRIYGSLNNDKSMRYLAESFAAANEADFKFQAGALLFRNWFGDETVSRARRSFIEWLGGQPSYHKPFATLDIFTHDGAKEEILLMLWNFHFGSLGAGFAPLFDILSKHGSQECVKAIENWRLLENLADTPQEATVRRDFEQIRGEECFAGMYLWRALEKLSSGRLPAWFLELCHRYLEDFRVGTSSFPIKLASHLRHAQDADRSVVLELLRSRRDFYATDHPSKGLNLLSDICQMESHSNEQNLALLRAYAERTVEYFLDHDLRGLAVERQFVSSLHHLLELLIKVGIANILSADAPVRPGASADVFMIEGVEHLLVAEGFWRELEQSLQSPITGTGIHKRAVAAWQAWMQICQKPEFQGRLGSVVRVDALKKLNERMRSLL